MENWIKAINDYKKIDNVHSDIYYEITLDMIKRFIDRVSGAELMERLEDEWSYEIKINNQSIWLELVLPDIGNSEIGYMYNGFKARYRILEVRSNYLSAEEFAKNYKVNASTVRQWIRRGKIRTAVKRGGTWRIPELTEKPKRGFELAKYIWDEELLDLPKEFNCLNDYCFILIMQDYYEKDKYHAYLNKEKKPIALNGDEELVLNKNQVEKLEAYLIANEDVEYLDTNNGITEDIINYIMCNNNDPWGVVR